MPARATLRAVASTPTPALVDPPSARPALRRDPPAIDRPVEFRVTVADDFLVSALRAAARRHGVSVSAYLLSLAERDLLQPPVRRKAERKRVVIGPDGVKMCKCGRGPRRPGRSDCRACEAEASRRRRARRISVRREDWERLTALESNSTPAETPPCHPSD